MVDIEDLGKRIESERARLELSNADVCSELDIHFNTYRNYENGKRDMPASLLAKLWHMGFDVMYILTGQRLDVLEKDAQGGAENTSGLGFARRLVHLPETMDIENPADALLVAMYHVEETLIQSGAMANTDYTRLDLAKVAVGLVDRVK